MLSTSKSSKTYKYYLDDNPTNKDEFEFIQIAQTLKETINQAKFFPTHISLMGEWGTGKSTVLKLLENSITNKDKMEIKTFSVWKFSDNSMSLQRRIVRQVQQSLGVDPSETTKILDQNTEEAIDTKGSGVASTFLSKYQFEKKLANLPFVLIFLQVLFFTVAFVFQTYWTLIPIAMLTAFNLLGKSSFSVNVKNRITTSPIEHDDQFEKHFQNAVELYTEKNKLEKLILVFDDLDRLPPNELYSTLNTIKTFLKSDKCIFIVPCDERVLRNELEYVFNERKFKVDVSEFLNKTFDITIKLPIIEKNNMHKYAYKILEDNNILWFNDEKIQSDINNILSVLIHSGIDTPRKVKKNLNAFASDWYLAQKRDISNGRDFLTSNPIELAIMTVIKSNFLKFFEIIQYRPTFFKDKSIRELEKDIMNEIQYTDFSSSKDTNALPIDEDSSESSVNSKNFDVEDFISMSFLKRVHHSLPQDIGAYVYFTNKQLNPITSTKELNDVKDALLNADDKTFVAKFKELSKSDKETLLDNMLSVINSDLEKENVLKTLINYPQSAGYITKEPYWVELLREKVSFIVKELNINSIYKFLVNLNKLPSSLWSSYGRAMKEFRGIEELVELWKDHPKAQESLELNDLPNDIINNASPLFKHYEGFYVPKLILGLSPEHPMAGKLDWWGILDDTLISIEKFNKEIEENNKDLIEENEQEVKYSNKLDFGLMHWINNVNEKSTQHINSNCLSSTLAMIYQSDPNLEGIGDYWKSLIKNATNENEIVNTLSFIRNYFEFARDFFPEEIYKAINGNRKIMGEKSNQELIVLLNYLKDEDSVYLLNVIQLLIDVPTVYNWCIDEYCLSNNELDRTISEILLHNETNINKDVLFENVNEKADESNDEFLKSTFNLLSRSTVFLNFAIDNGYFEKWFSSQPNEVLHYPIETFNALLDNKELSNDKVGYKLYLISGINFILEKSDLLTTNHSHQDVRMFPYKGQWQKHLDELFMRLVNLAKDVKWSEVLSELSEVTLKNKPQVKVSLFEKLSSEVIDKTIPLIHANTPKSDEEINKLIIEYCDTDNIEHIEPLAVRWRKFDGDYRRKAVTSMSNESYKMFIPLLVKQIKQQPQLSYIRELYQEEFKESDKEIILETIIKYENIYSINTWIEEQFKHLINPFGYWEEKAFNFIVQNYENLQPLGYTFVRDALSFKDNRTDVVLKLIPLMYSKKDGKYAKEHFRGLILDLVNDENGKFVELANQAKETFNWKNTKNDLYISR